jgi:type I restriction enzyme S subunit
MKLGDVAYYVTKRVSADKVTKDTYISTENMRPNKDGFMPSDELPPYPSYTSYDEHDILISNIRPYFKKILYAKANGGCSNDVLVLRAKDPDNYSSSFLYYALSQDYFFNFMMAGAKGTKMPRGNKKSILDFELPEYNLAKQERIATILSHYDDLIEINKRRIALLEESARELYKEWFVRMRFPGWKNIDEKDLPANWKVLRIDDIYETGSGGTPKAGNKIYYNGNINWLRTGELDDSFIFETEIKISEDGLENSSAKMYHRHDVVIAMYGATIGKLGILTGNTSVNQACCVLTPKNSFYDYAFIYLSLIEYRHELIHQRMGAAQQNISQETIRKFKLKFPPLEIMAAFNQKAHPIFDAIEVILRENQILSLQRDRLLPRLMSGQLEV